VIDHRARIGGQARPGAADVRVDLHDLLDGRGLEERGRDALLHGEDGAVRGGDADGGGAELREGTGARREGSGRSRCSGDER
jgi:hypothetical protein